MQNIIESKAIDFSREIIKVYDFLWNKKKERILSEQILKSSTSIGANIIEAQNAESKNDFIHKMSISQKEADETLYWLELLRMSNLIDKKQYESLRNKGKEIAKILTSIIVTSKKNNSNIKK